MKILKRILVVFVGMMMIFMGTFAALAEDDALTLYQRKNYESTDAYTRMVDSFNLTGLPNDPAYPKEYGGAFIDDEGNLVVQYVETPHDDMVETRSGNEDTFSAEKVADITGLETALTEEVKYSYNELLSTKNTISAYVQRAIEARKTGQLSSATETLPFKGKITQTAIDNRNNSVVVWLDDISPESIADFRKNVCDAPYLVFKYDTGDAELQASYELGEGDLNGGSIGFPATFNGYT